MTIGHTWPKIQLGGRCISTLFCGINTSSRLAKQKQALKFTPAKNYLNIRRI
jgi:hypothetical protein